MAKTLFRSTLAALALVLLCTATAQAATIQSSGALDGNSPTFNRRSDQTGNPASANTGLPYAVVGFTTGATGGTVTAAVGNTTQFDSFLTLYSAFDAANPQNNVLAADDDGGTYPHAALSKAGLAANTAYVLVIASYSSQADAVFPVYGSFALSISGDVTDNWSITTTASPPAGGSVSCAPSSVAQGGNSTCTATANAGYTFTAFSGDCSGATCVLTNVTAAKAVTATFTQNSYAITTTASPLDGGTISCSANPVVHGSGSTCTASANVGYTFSAFSGDCSGAICVLTNVTAAKAVTATFTQNSYTITTTASPLAGGTVSCSANPVVHGSGSTCTASANVGYTFASFSGDCTGATCVLSNVTAARAVTATFTQNSYAITTTASPLAGGTVSCSANPVVHGSGSTCTASANVGYTFSAFSGDCSGATCVLTNVTAAKAVTATFTQNSYIITTTASPLAGGTVSCSANPVAHGSGSTCTASANPGYDFGAFSGDCTGATCVLGNVTAVKAVTASFVANTAPLASAVAISGTAQVNAQLTGSYTYSDAETNPQGTSTFRWMADTLASGATKTAVVGATSISYTATAAVEGKYLFFCVTPVASAGTTTGVEVCSGASAVVAPAPVVTSPTPPLIPPANAIPPGLAGGPVPLDMTGGSGPAIAADAARVLERVAIPGMQYVGQSTSGAMIMSIPGGQKVVFAPIAVQANDPRPDGLYPVGNGQYQIVASGVALTVVPAVQSLPQLLALLPVGASVTMGSNGVLVAKLGGVTYVVQPGVFVQVVGNPSGVPTLLFGADGYLHFTDAAGNSQTLYPAFMEADALLRTLRSLDPSATMQIQLDGTAQVRFQGQNLVIVPDLTLGGVPAGQEGGYWWQEGPGRYRARVQGSWFDFLSQGFTVR